MTHLRRCRSIGRIGRGQREQHHLEDALLGVVAVRPEPVHDRVEAAPRRPVREHREEDRVDELGVADSLDVDGVAHLPLHLSPLAVRQPAAHVGHLRRRMGRHQRHLFQARWQRAANPLAQVRVGLGLRTVDVVAVLVEGADVAVQVGDGHLPIGVALVDVAAQRMPPAAVLLAVVDALPAGLPVEMRAGHAGGGHRPAVVAEGVVAAVGVAERFHQRGMGRHHVVALHEGLLAGLPVHRHELGDVCRLVPALERHEFEVVGQVAQVVGQRRGIAVGVDEHEPVPGVDQSLGQPVVGHVHIGKVPLAGDLPQRAVELPAPAVEGAAKAGRAPPVVLAQLAAPVQAGVAVGLDLVGGGADNQERQVRDVIDVVVADLGDLFGEAGELPRAAPQSLDFQVMDVVRVVHPGRHPRVARQVLADSPQDVRYRMRVVVEQLVIADPSRAIGARQRFGHGKNVATGERSAVGGGRL